MRPHNKRMKLTTTFGGTRLVIERRAGRRRRLMPARARDRGHGLAAYPQC
jgi:hypothetical protein